MSEARSTADSVGTEVTRTLDEATVAADEILAQADRRADRAGRDELAELRRSLEARIKTVRDTRERLAKLGHETASRLRATSAQLSEMPGKLSLSAQDGTGTSAFDRAFDGTDRAAAGPPAHLVALVEAADKIASDLAETGRKRALELEHAARREADRIALAEPKRVARAYDPTARRAEALRREVEGLNRLLNEDVMGANGSNERTQDETGPDGRWGSHRRRRQRL